MLKYCIHRTSKEIQHRPWISFYNPKIKTACFSYWKWSENISDGKLKLSFICQKIIASFDEFTTRSTCCKMVVRGHESKLSWAVKAMNNLEKYSWLVPSLIVVEAIPRLSCGNSCVMNQHDRMNPIVFKQSEMETINVQVRPRRALQHSAPFFSFCTYNVEEKLLVDIERR